MLRSLLVSILLVAVKSEHNINDLVGDWMPGVSYPKTEYTPSCFWNKITAEESLTCTCGGKQTPAVKLVDTPTGPPVTFPVIFINETEDVASALRTNCSCDGKPTPPGAVRKLDGNYFVGYYSVAPLDLIGKNEYYTFLYVKKAPKLSELQGVAGRISELQGKKLQYWCESSFYLKEDS